MQITGGYLKGRKLYSPPKSLNIIRPLRTRVRKALFDILGQTLPSWNILDLFAGTGALGIEAISRGAKFVVFVDSSPLSISIIKKNLEKFNLQQYSQILKLELPKGLRTLSIRFPNFFNLVFITPPYEKNILLKTLKVFPENILQEKAIIIGEEKTGIVLPSEIKRLKKIKERSYGETTLHIYQMF